MSRVTLDLVDELRHCEGPEPALARQLDGSVTVVPDARAVWGHVMVTKKVLIPVCDDIAELDLLQMLESLAETGKRLDWLYRHPASESTPE